MIVNKKSLISRTKVLGYAYALLLQRTEYSNNPFLRTIGGALRANIQYFPNEYLLRSWRDRAGKSMISWYSFIFSNMLREFTTYVFPAQNCRTEKRMLQLCRQRVNSLQEYSENILVSVIIPTYNRSTLLTTHGIPSVLKQTHKNLELIVIGDHCVDDTEIKVKAIRDPRLKFIDLPQRGDYPKIDVLRWLVAGSIPVNAGLSIARGDWIAHLDDDVEISSDHIEKSLKFALKNNLELAHSPAGEQVGKGEWRYHGRPDAILHATVLCKGYLKFFKYDTSCWKINEPVDFNRWKRMKISGVRIGFSSGERGVRYLTEEQSQYNKKSCQH